MGLPFGLRINVGSNSLGATFANWFTYANTVQIVSLEGCGGLYVLTCYPGASLRIHGASSFRSPVNNVTIGGVLCINSQFSSADVITCSMPTMPWELLGEVQPVVVACGNQVSPPFIGIVSYGQVAVTSASGCAYDAMNGTLPWRTSGCKAGDVITVRGTHSTSIDRLTTEGSMFQLTRSPCLCCVVCRLWLHSQESHHGREDQCKRHPNPMPRHDGVEQHHPSLHPACRVLHGPLDLCHRHRRSQHVSRTSGLIHTAGPPHHFVYHGLRGSQRPPQPHIHPRL